MGKILNTFAANVKPPASSLRDGVPALQEKAAALLSIAGNSLLSGSAKERATQMSNANGEALINALEATDYDSNS